MSFTEWTMVAVGVCYTAAALSWWLVDGKPWMAATFFLYALTAVTLYLAGKA